MKSCCSKIAVSLAPSSVSAPEGPDPYGTSCDVNGKAGCSSFGLGSLKVHLSGLLNPTSSFNYELTLFFCARPVSYQPSGCLTRGNRHFRVAHLNCSSVVEARLGQGCRPQAFLTPVSTVAQETGASRKSTIPCPSHVV